MGTFNIFKIVYIEKDSNAHCYSGTSILAIRVPRDWCGISSGEVSIYIRGFVICAGPAD